MYPLTSVPLVEPHSHQQATAEQQAPPFRSGLPSAYLMNTDRLPRTLRTRDLLALTVVVVLLFTNVPLVASAGGASLVYWSIGFLCFLLPSALIAAQLFRLFPGEAAVYQWMNRALGNFWDSFLGLFCNWWPGGAVGLTVEAGAVVASLQLVKSDWLMLPWQQGLAELLVLFFAQLLCLLPPRLFSRCLLVVVASYLGVMGLLGWAGLVWVLRGQPIQADLSAHGWQLHPEQYPIVGIVMLALLGMVIPLNMGAELRGHDTARRALVWGSIIIVAGYLLTTLAVLVVLPPKDLSNPAFVIEIFTLAFGPLLGSVFGTLHAVVMVIYFFFATAVYNQVFSRFLLVAALDKRLPARLARVSADGIPRPALWTQTLINAGFLVFVFFLAPALAPTTEQFSFIVFLVVMNAAGVVWNVAMIGLFVSAMVLFVRERIHLSRCRIVPVWVLHLASLAGIGASLIAIGSTFFTGSPVPQVVNSGEWSFWVLLIVLGSMALGAVYSYLVPEAEDIATLFRTHSPSRLKP